MSKDKKTLACLIVVIMILVCLTAYQAWETEELKKEIQSMNEQKAPVITEGQYTIIHYAPGWTNAIYITAYYYKGNYIHYLEQGSTEYKQLWAPAILPVDGWVEEDKLMDYGYWLPDDIGLGE